MPPLQQRILRVTGVGLAAFLGAWDVVRLLSVSDVRWNVLDILKCPGVLLVEAMDACLKHLTPRADSLVIGFTLLISNMLIYAAVAFLGLRLTLKSK